MRLGKILAVLAAPAILFGQLATSGRDGRMAAIHKSTGEAGDVLTIASLTLRIHQLLGSVNEQQRLARMSSLAGTLVDSGAGASERAEWNRAFDLAARSFFEYMNGAAQRAPDPPRAVRMLADARTSLGFQRGAGGDLARALTRAIAILDMGQPQARYSVAFQGVDQEVETLLAGRIGAIQVQAPVRPGGALGQPPIPPKGPGNGPVVGQGTGTPGPVTGGSPGGANVALGRPVRTSSRSQWSTASEAGGNDGVKNGGFGFHTETEANPWWEVDLGQVTRLAEIRVYNRAGYEDRARTMRVLLNDGVNWRVAHDQGGRTFGANGQPLRVPLNGAAARWVRLQLQETTYLHLDEVEIYSAGSAPGPVIGNPGPVTGGSPGGANVALGRPARTSSRSQWSTASEAGGNDGVKNGGFGFHTETEANPWWEVDLGQVTRLAEIRVYNRAGYEDRARTMRILLNDGVNWRVAHDQGGQPFGANGQPLRVPLNGAAARWVRLQLQETTYLHLDEVEIYSAGSTPGPVTGNAGGQVRFLGEDAATQGNWNRVYGAEGSYVVGGGQAVPAWVKPRDAGGYTWASATSEPRALLTMAGSRTAAVWYSNSVFHLDFDTGATPRRLAVYVLDWDAYGGGRSQRMEMLDASGAVLDSRVVSAFGAGKYLVYDVSGRLTLRSTALSGNAVVAGVFLGGR